MNRLVRIGIWGTWFLVDAAVGLGWTFALIQGEAEIWDWLGYPSDLAAPAPWTLVLETVALFVLLLAFGAMCWFIDRVLVRGARLEFATLARAMRGLAAGLLVFYLAFKAGDSLGPWLMLRSVQLPEGMDNSLDLFGLDIILLFLSVALFAIARVLREAAQIDAENKQFI